MPRGSFLLLTLTLPLAAAACSATGKGPAADANAPIDSAALVDSSIAIDPASQADLAGDKTYSIPVGDCFTFATATSHSMGGQSCGDLLTLSGANIDLTAGSGSASLCDLGGPFANLAAVPSSYANCMWTSYIEGINGLAGEGLVVLDAAGLHHYRVRIASNMGANLLLSFSAID